MAPARFPTLSSNTLPVDPQKTIAAMRESLSRGTVSDGYLRVTAPAGEGFLFFHQGKVHSAGALEEDRFSARTFPEFFSMLASARAVTLCQTDPAILLCTAVLFRKAPSAQIPSRLLNSEELLFAIRETGKDAVLVVRNADARSLVFCKGGEPVALYAADGEPFPGTATVADQIVGYLKSRPDCQLDLYDDIKLKPAAGAGQPLENYVSSSGSPKLAAAKDAATPSLIVRLGERIAFRFPVEASEALIGRGEEADLPLDNVSISRRHALIRKKGAMLVIEDLGSENGIFFKGDKVRIAELNPGDEVGIGKYTLIYPRYASQTEGISTHGPRSSSAALRGEETMMMGISKVSPAVFELDGQKVKMGGLVFNIGKASDAHLKIAGLFVAPIHVRILRDPSGVHSLQHVAGLRKVLVNGAAVKTTALKDGDVITIAGKSIKVAIAERTSGSGPAVAASARLGPK